MKFFGGTLAIGAGLALGREGPTIPMGAVIGNWIGSWIPGASDNLYVLMAAGAGAGLATAFNAPVGGAVFVFEEVLQRFNIRLLATTTVSCTAAIAVARLALGAQLGFLCGTLGHAGLPNLVPEPTAFAVVGMAAFFTATVRSPFTGSNKPIYDALGERQVAAQDKDKTGVQG